MSTHDPIIDQPLPPLSLQMTPRMEISTVYRKQRARVTGLAAKIIDVQPGSGETAFTLPESVWEAFINDGAFLSDDWWVTFELAMWERALKYEITWLQVMQNEQLVLTDNNTYASQYNPRVITACLLVRMFRQIGNKKKYKLGYEYSSERDAPRRGGRRAA